MSKNTPKFPNCLPLKPRTFIFYNGDTYTGEYTIDLSNKIIYRHGFGTYANTNGIKITGNWIKDIIAGEVTIEYGKYGKYVGFLSKSMDYTVGEVSFPDGSKFSGDFKKNFENRRIDGVTFNDPNGKIWNHSITEDDGILLEFDWQQDDENCETSPCHKLKIIE